MAWVLFAILLVLASIWGMPAALKIMRSVGRVFLWGLCGIAATCVVYVLLRG